MLFPLYQSTRRPELQRQLDADQQRWSRSVELQTDGEFSEEQLTSFRMKGLFGQIPGNDLPPIPLRAKSFP